MIRSPGSPRILPIKGNLFYTINSFERKRKKSCKIIKGSARELAKIQDEDGRRDGSEIGDDTHG